MFFERAQEDEMQDKKERFSKAKRDYDNAVNRFNCAKSGELARLAVFDMNTAMKRLCVIIKSEQQ